MDIYTGKAHTRTNIYTNKHIYGGRGAFTRRDTKGEIYIWERRTYMDKYTNWGTYKWGNTHKRIHTQRDIYTEGHTHEGGGTYMDKHTYKGIHKRGRTNTEGLHMERYIHRKTYTRREIYMRDINMGENIYTRGTYT